MPEFCFGTCNASQKRRGHQHPSGNWTAARGRERWDGERWGLVLFYGIIDTFCDLLSGLGLIFWGCKHGISGSLFCPAPRPEAKKNHLRSKWIFLASGWGVWAFNFWHLFRFSMCYPKGAHSLGHRWGYGSRNKGISIFQCATPRGLIHDTTVWGTAPGK